MKANSNQSVIRTLVAEGAGVDVVSEGEIAPGARRRLPARADRLLRRRQDRARDRLRDRRRHLLLQRRIGARTRPHLGDRRGEGARRRQVAIRVNPDVDAKTHAKITTGKAENKFGIPFAAPARSMPTPRACPASASPASTCISAARSPTSRPSTRPSRLLADLVRDLRADGQPIDHVDAGGGLGIPYRLDDAAAARARRPMARSCAAGSATSAAASCSSPAG